MKFKFVFLLCFAVVFVITPNLMADAPKVGRAAAAKYFQKNPELDATQYRNTASEMIAADFERYLTLGFSAYTKSESYSWGTSSKEESVAKWGADISYRLSQYNALLDYSLKVSYNEFEPANQRANKISFLYAATFPDAGSRFPLYFGVAGGVGVFMTQLSDESPVSFDYQLYAGARIFDVFEKTGFYIEGGLKNHMQLTSSGQLNGTYLGAGAVFTF